MNLISYLRSAIRQIATQLALPATIALSVVLGLGTSAIAFTVTRALLLQAPATHELSREFMLDNESVSSANRFDLADLDGTQLIRFSSRSIGPRTNPHVLLRLSHRVPDLAEQLEQELQAPIAAQTLRHHSNGLNLLSAAFGPALLGIITALAASIPGNRNSGTGPGT
jgi:hypothetical protein